MGERGRIDPRVDIGYVHLNVADLDRALAFYEGVLGFDVTQRVGDSTAFLSAGGYHHHIGLSTSEDAGGSAATSNGTSSLYRFAIRYPDRHALADALRRITAAGVALEGASDTGVGEALYLRDPDGYRVELYWDRPREQWPRTPDGALVDATQPLDISALRALAPDDQRQGAAAEALGPDALSEGTRMRLREMRVRLLALHKVLLDDAKAAYQMDRGQIASSATLLHLVINDPWFAWLHPLSELVVRIDETLQPDAPATEQDGAVLLEEVERLVTPGSGTGPFAERYYEALQRQPAVIMAHAEVRRILKQAR